MWHLEGEEEGPLIKDESQPCKSSSARSWIRNRNQGGKKLQLTGVPAVQYGLGEPGILEEGVQEDSGRGAGCSFPLSPPPR